MPLRATTWQTVGPFFSIGMEKRYRDDLTEGAAGERVEIRGRVLDGDGVPVPDAVIEIWQADSHGNYPLEPEAGIPSKDFIGFGRVATNDAGEFHFKTIVPGAVAEPHGGKQAPHLAVSFFCRGLLRRLVARMYFPDQPWNEQDVVLQKVSAERRATLIAKAGGKGILLWDIVLQGKDETVFFEI